MMKTDQILAILRDINETLANDGIKLEGVFGSYVRGEAEDFSDIDILYSTDPVRFFPDDGFAKAIYLQNLKKRLEGIFRRPVDLIPKKQEQSAFYVNIRQEFRSV